MNQYKKTNGPFSDATYLNIALYDRFVETHTNHFWHKLWHLLKTSLKLLNLASFRFKNTGETERKK